MYDRLQERVRLELDVFDEMTEAVEDYLESTELEELQRNALVSLVCAGGEAASLVYGRYEPSLRLFGELDEAAARRFAMPFIVAMTSRFATTMSELYPEFLTRPEVREEYSEAALRLFGLDFDRHRQESLAVDRQYLHDAPLGPDALDGRVEGVLLLSLGARNLGATFGWPVRTPPLPVDGLDALREAGWHAPLGLSTALDTRRRSRTR